MHQARQVERVFGKRTQDRFKFYFYTALVQAVTVSPALFYSEQFNLETKFCQWHLIWNVTEKNKKANGRIEVYFRKFKQGADPEGPARWFSFYSPWIFEHNRFVFLTEMASQTVPETSSRWSCHRRRLKRWSFHRSHAFNVAVDLTFYDVMVTLSDTEVLPSRPGTSELCTSSVFNTSRFIAHSPVSTFNYYHDYTLAPSYGIIYRLAFALLTSLTLTSLFTKTKKKGERTWGFLLFLLVILIYPARKAPPVQAAATSPTYTVYSCNWCCVPLTLCKKRTMRILHTFRWNYVERPYYWSLL